MTFLHWKILASSHSICRRMAGIITSPATSPPRLRDLLTIFTEMPHLPLYYPWFELISKTSGLASKIIIFHPLRPRYQLVNRLIEYEHRQHEDFPRLASFPRCTCHFLFELVRHPHFLQLTPVIVEFMLASWSDCFSTYLISYTMGAHLAQDSRPRFAHSRPGLWYCSDVSMTFRVRVWIQSPYMEAKSGWESDDCHQIVTLTDLGGTCRSARVDWDRLRARFFLWFPDRWTPWSLWRKGADPSPHLYRYSWKDSTWDCPSRCRQRPEAAS